MNLSLRSILVAPLCAGLILAWSPVAPGEPLHEARADASGRPEVSTRQAERNVSMTVFQAAPGSSTITVRVTGVSRRVSVEVDFGDGTPSRTVTSTCTYKRAVARPGACGRSFRHTYAPRLRSEGKFSVAARMSTRDVIGDVQIVWTRREILSVISAQGNWRRDLLARVNDVRARVGVGPLVLCSTLTAAAQGYADVMMATGHFGHIGEDGSTPSSRAQAAGYGPNAGENIAAGQVSVGDVVRAWIASPSHYANLTSAAYSHVGFGFAYDSPETYGTRWAQELGFGGTC